MLYYIPVLDYSIPEKDRRLLLEDISGQSSSIETLSLNQRSNLLQTESKE